MILVLVQDKCLYLLVHFFVNGDATMWLLFQEHFSVMKLHLQEMESTISTTNMCGQSKILRLFRNPFSEKILGIHFSWNS